MEDTLLSKCIVITVRIGLCILNSISTVNQLLEQFLHHSDASLQ